MEMTIFCLFSFSIESKKIKTTENTQSEKLDAKSCSKQLPVIASADFCIHLKHAPTNHMGDPL